MWGWMKFCLFFCDVCSTYCRSVCWARWWAVWIFFPKVFRSNFHASFSRSNQYLYQIQCAQNSFSRNIMRISIRAMCLKRDDLDKQILQCRSELSKICPVVLLNSIRAKIQQLNATLFNHLHQIKTQNSNIWLVPKLAVMQHLIAKTP